MSTILHIDSSPRTKSISRRLSQKFIDSFVAANPDTKVIRRDLNANPPPFVDEAYINAAFGSEPNADSEALALSDAWTAEYLEADIIVLGMPMYNWSIPAIVKAYIDQIVRYEKTFTFGANGVEGVVKGKKLVAVISRGGDYLPSSPMAFANFQEPYISTLFKFLGAEEVHYVHVQSLRDYANLESKIVAAEGEIAELAAKLA